ncbi:MULTISPECIES: porin [Giesbergeria]|uniref:Porin n=1 Tax=Giesbergeria sinuosa TaxID=80883 RepID=A0ABV9QA92_9BURK
MNKHFLALAIAAIGTPALAQNATSSLTLYGIVDAGVMHNSNNAGQSETRMASGYLQTSRFGFRGTEDLGGGLRALFTLESGLNVTTGASSSTTTLFNRQAFMGLSSSTLGTLTLGRQYTPVYDHLIALSGAPTFGVGGGAVDGIAAPGSTVARFDNTLGGTRIDSSFKYTSPEFSGFKFNAMWQSRPDASSAKTGQLSSVGLGYNAGALSSGLGYIVRKCSSITTGCTATTDDDKLWALGVGYDLGMAKLAGIYTSQKNAKNVKDSDGDVLHLMVKIPVGGWHLAAGYQHLNDKSVRDEDVRQFNLSALYYLSKRTSVYGAYSHQKVDNGGKASMAVTTSSDSKQNVYAVGIRHVF